MPDKWRFGGESTHSVFILGRKDLGDPVIRKVPGGMELMMAPSLSVQVAPSMLSGISDRVLTEGHLAILPKHLYEEAGVDQRLALWFQTLARELRKVLRPPQVVLYTTGGDDPPALARRKCTVSSAALGLQRDCVKFKQFVSSRIELFARESGSVGEPNP